MERDFKNNIYPDILDALEPDTTYYTKTRNEPNHVIIENQDILVMTNRSKPDHQHIPYELFHDTWKILNNQKTVTQNELSSRFNIKRSAFMLIAFSLLDYVDYNSTDNSLNVNRDWPLVLRSNQNPLPPYFLSREAPSEKYSGVAIG